jgi:creatinine amidohydrolase
MIAVFSEMTPEGLQALLPDLTVFLFPVGGLEQHGPHLPFGVKLLQAETTARTLAEELQKRLPAWNYVLMPVIPLTVDGITNRLALPVRPHVVRDALVDQCEQLKRLGFTRFLAVNAHLSPKQITTLEDAARIVSGRSWWIGKKSQLISVTGALVDAKTVFESPLIALPQEHGGERDASFMLAHAPEQVSKNILSLPAQPRPRASMGRFFKYLSHEIDGYWGAPGSAKADHAQIDLIQEVSLLVEKLIPWLERGKGARQFLTAYRYFPFNGSFFKAYVLALIFSFMMLAWILWSVKDVFVP